MTCPVCGKRCRITQTFKVADGSKTHIAQCVPCDKVFTLLTVVVTEATRRGKGAYALARKIEREEVKVTYYKGRTIVREAEGGS